MKLTVPVISCTHAVNYVPEQYRNLFTGHEALLDSSRSVDHGALTISQHLQNALNCPATKSQVTHLLIDCNRSYIRHQCFSKFTRNLPLAEKQRLIDLYYLTFREQTQQLIQTEVDRNNQVLHLSIHTFAPHRGGLIRNAGLGILYDSRRHGEKEVARLLHGLLMQQQPLYRTRMNYPLLGYQDNLTASLRKKYTEHDYLGLEIQCNRALMQDEESTRELLHALTNALKELFLLL